MFLYIIKRVFYLIPLLIGITLLTFLLTRSLPGDPALNLVGERANPEVLENIRKDIGADSPFFIQYAGYLKMLLKGQMGVSYFTKREVFADILLKFPNTLMLAFCAMSIAIPFGLILGFFTAERRGTIIDRVVTSLSVMGLSVPVFWSGLLIMLLFSLKMKLFPPSGTGGLRFMVLPAITLALPALATIARITRTSVIEIQEMPFINTARAKGLNHRRIQFVHVFRNVIIPVITVAGLDFGSYLNGSVLTETIFGWDGIGKFTMEGIIRRDYPVIMGCIIVGTVVFVLINLMVDIAYHYLDPRVKLHEVRR
ncbi:dipeptide transport system permease protein DppB [bacterium BMS3Abin07]|nr:dipeptide transport system permease protein DppB [bacterium BMS3Abin07]GBE31309.1 dipeptide transport system permease protein DppB [bacterium BMS3Bbin05]HDO22146.1 ABC transporter permease [Nitrospirota bacterium]HDZ88290.1 ABC transporter permease [Nitrospirota bacterium]